MKTYLYPILAALPFLFSCNKTDLNQFSTPEFASHAGKLVLDEAVKSAEAVPAGSIVSIEFTESGLYVLGQASADEGVEYSSGTFTVSGSRYTLQGFGTAEFDNSKDGSVSLSLTRGSVTQTHQASYTKAVGGNQLYRSWTIDKTRVTIVGWTVASADFEGCNFYEIAKFVRDSGHKAPADIAPGFGVRSLSFTGNNSVFFLYTDDTLHMGEFSLSGNNISYRWDNDTMGFTFHTEKATVEYMDGKCLLSVSATIVNSTTSGSVTFVLSPVQ
ncbi:MAG: hypothetical protein J6M31_01490 [Bacteroidales bacterium]|nr:hypothetical protein [Bacteroidales bacterium]